MEQTKLTPKFFFVSIGVLIALITSVTALVQLIFETLNHALPDILTDSYQYGYANYSYEGMRSSIALLIIVFPIYLILERFWVKIAHHTLSQWDEILKRWAIYLILFLASIAVLADLVVLVRYFVSGEITTRFIFKVLAVLIVAGMVGWYYVRKLMLTKENRSMWFVLGASVIVLAALVWSFMITGGPASQRQLRLDQRRTSDLQSIQWQIINFWQQKERLPESLEEFKDPISSYMVPQDPEWQDGRVYEYTKKDADTFELCATFALPMPKGYVPMETGMRPMRDMAVSSMPYPGGGMNDSWDHEGGRTCFERTIDPDMYPPFPKERKI